MKFTNLNFKNQRISQLVMNMKCKILWQGKKAYECEIYVPDVTEPCRLLKEGTENKLE